MHPYENSGTTGPNRRLLNLLLSSLNGLSRFQGGFQPLSNGFSRLLGPDGLGRKIHLYR